MCVCTPACVQSTNEILTPWRLWYIVYPTYLFMNIWCVSSAEFLQKHTVNERSICNINTGLSLMLFSFGKHRTTVYFHIPPSLMIDASGAPYLLTSYIHPPPPPSPFKHTHTSHPTRPSLFSLSLWLCQQQHQQYLGLCVSFISSC